MRPARQNPDGRPRRQPQRGDGDGGDGIRGHGQLALTETRVGLTVVPPMKSFLALPLVALTGACIAPPPPPPITPNPPGNAYPALGTEPFLGLTIDPRQMVLTPP